MALVTDFTGNNAATFCSSEEAHQNFAGSCAECRHGRYNPGPPSKPGGFYGNLKVGAARRRWKVNRLHDQALREDAERERAKHEGDD